MSNDKIEDRPPPLFYKSQMYHALSTGQLGNSVPMFFGLEEWLHEKDDCNHYGLWGVRSLTPGDRKRCRLNVPTGEVAEYWCKWFGSGGGNISPMLDRWAVLRGQVLEPRHPPFGLTLDYVPPGKVDEESPWHGSFNKYGTTARGIVAWEILRCYLWPSDLEDLRVLLERYPGHVVEFSACDRAVGLIANRNTVWWEVRLY